MREAYEAYGAGIYRFAVRALHDPGLAEEVVQDTFLRAWRARDRYDSAAGSPRTWLFAIARNVAADLARARAARPRSSELRDETGFVDDPSEHVHRSWQVEEALERLSHDHRYVVVEIAVNQRACSDVAVDLGVPEGTVRSRLYYALRALGFALADLGYDDGLRRPAELLPSRRSSQDVKTDSCRPAGGLAATSRRRAGRRSEPHVTSSLSNQKSPSVSGSDGSVP